MGLTLSRGGKRDDDYKDAAKWFEIKKKLYRLLFSKLHL